MFYFVNIFIFLFRSKIKNNRPNGAQYIITKIICEVAIANPIIVAGARIV
jgi:hypothetical protein